MIGNMISMIRREKGLTKTELAEITGINIGHLTHIEKGERNPSHKALSSICEALDIPFEEMLHTYDKTLTLEQEKYDYLKYVPYNQIPLFSNLVENKDYGLFKVNDEFLIRKLLYRKGGLVLRAENKDLEIEDVLVSDLKEFEIIGRIYIDEK